MVHLRDLFIISSCILTKHPSTVRSHESIAKSNPISNLRLASQVSLNQAYKNHCIVYIMDHLSLDAALDLEETFYEKGFQEGHDHSVREQFLEGKIYGLQTGFQRFIIVGYLQGLLEEWSKPEQSQSTSLKTHLEQLRRFLTEISFSNDDHAVAQYEKSITSARNKARVIAAITKTSDKISRLDGLIKEIGGNLQVSEDLNEMW
ncbi:hypothetical protein JCM33374_g5562 [Metschnikowia sp. JCM 33374]|nr:hypothetical protein JCM33374_g5562 [Metschnikowia sp. JCM 33374]